MRKYSPHETSVLAKQTTTTTTARGVQVAVECHLIPSRTRTDDVVEAATVISLGSATAAVLPVPRDNNIITYYIGVAGRKLRNVL